MSPSGDRLESGTRAEQLLEAIAMTTPLPWSGLTPADYPQDSSAIIELEREAGRLPHQRLEHP